LDAGCKILDFCKVSYQPENLHLCAPARDFFARRGAKAQLGIRYCKTYLFKKDSLFNTSISEK
jgi:hypothetical protein